MEELKLRPRPRTTTAGADLSRPMDRQTRRRLQEDIEALKDIYTYEGESQGLYDLNNSILREIQLLLHGQGVSSSLTPSLLEDALSLTINGAHPQGNRVARLYLKASELQGVPKLSFSLLAISGDATALFLIIVPSWIYWRKKSTGKPWPISVTICLRGKGRGDRSPLPLLLDFLR